MINVFKKMGKAIVYVYVFIILMLLGLIAVTNLMLNTLT